MSERASSRSAHAHALAEHRAKALEAADGAERALAHFENTFPDDDRPRKAIEAARAWARGEIRVGEARAAALAAHAAARGAAGSPTACAAARAAGHAAATAHVITHAQGVEFYVKKVEAARARRRLEGGSHPVRTKRQSSRRSPSGSR